MNRRRKKVYDDDDGRTIADMSGVDMGRGMPGSPIPTPSSDGQKDDPYQSPVVYTPEEKRAIAFGALRAALLVGGVFVLGFTLFLLFCIFIWF